MIDFITNLKKISNDFNKIKKYLDFIKDHKLKEYSKNSERHHILPKSVFPEFNDYNKYPENFAVLSIVDHYICHSMLADMSEEQSLIFAWNAMNSKTSKLKKIKLSKSLKTEEYEKLKLKAREKMSEANKGWTVITENGKNIRIRSKDYDRKKYKTPFNGRVCVTIKSTNEKKWINTSDYDPEIHSFHTAGKATYYDLINKKKIRIEPSKREPYHLFMNEKVLFRNKCGLMFYDLLRKHNYEDIIGYKPISFNFIHPAKPIEKIVVVNKNGRIKEKTTRMVYKTDKIIGSGMIPFKFIPSEPLIKKERTYNKTEKWFKTVENKRGKTVTSNHTIASKKDFLSGKVHGINYGKHYYFDTETLKRVLLLPENAPSPRFIIYHIAKEKGIV